MITSIILEQYEVNGGFSSGERRTESIDITHLVIDDEYILDYALELGDVVEYNASSINLGFVNGNVGNYKLRDWLTPYFGVSSARFAGVLIYIDYNTTPEFWGYIDMSTIEYDYEQNKIYFTAIDFSAKYFDLWETADLPAVSSLTKPIYLSNYLNLIIPNTLLSGVNVNVGEMANDWLLTYFYETYLIPDGKTRLKYWIRELQKVFGAYIYCDANKKLNFINRTKYNNTISFDDSKIINVISDSFSPQKYTALLVSYFYDSSLTDPKLPTGIAADSDYLIDQDGNVIYLQPVIQNGSYVDDIDLMLRYYAPQHRFTSLDVRQRMPLATGQNGYAFDVMQMMQFHPIVRGILEHRYNAYKNVFQKVNEKTITYYGYNFNLMDRFYFEDRYYIIIAIKKNLSNNTCELKVREDVNG